MLITLNLLSPADKQSYRTHKRSQLAVATAGAVVTVIIALTGVAKGVEMMLAQTWDRIQATRYAGSAEFNSAIKKMNTLAALVNTADQARRDWSTALVELARAAPEGITLAALRVDAAAGMLSLQGVARERAEVLQLQDSMEHSALFTDVHIPLQDLSEKTNLHFTLTATVQPEFHW